MKYPVHMSAQQADQIEYDVVSDELKIYLTRRLTNMLKASDGEIELIKMNNIINKSRTIAGRSIYVLDADEDGNYMPQEYAWHFGEIALIFRRLSTPELADFLADLVAEQYFEADAINELLEKDGVSFRIENRRDKTQIEVLAIEDIESSEPDKVAHPNIRVLVSRMENSLKAEDFAGVLHSSASIFETLAKIVVGRPPVQDQTLKSFFDRYRKDSGLPEEILDYILSVYDKRNITPLAGHGSTATPTITKEQSIILAEMTKAFVKIEYKLSLETK